MNSEEKDQGKPMAAINIKRINELARKAKTVEGLTEEEALEQQHLRKEYIVAFRESLKQKLDNIILVDENGNQRSLRKDH